jgi:hypothetical protein
LVDTTVVVPKRKENNHMGTNESSRIQLSPKKHVLLIGILFAVLVFVLPFGYGLDLGPGPDNIRALIWEYLDAPWFSGFRIVSIGTFLGSLLYAFPRFVLLYIIIRYFLGKANKKAVILAGIAAELFPMAVSGVRIVGWLQGWTQPPPPLSDPWFPVYISIPLLFFFALILVFVTPSAQKHEQ